MSVAFDITPEREWSIPQFIYRQLFVTPALILPTQVDLRGQTAIVTGSNGGVGLECCRQLKALGLAKLIIAVRDEEKGIAAREELSAGQETLLIKI